MSESKEMLETWFKRDGKKLEDWAKKYLYNSPTFNDLLAKNKLGSPNFIEYDLDSFIDWIDWLYHHTLGGAVEVSRMKAAWSQKKYRSNLKSHDKKTYNFVMSRDIKKKLATISKSRNLPINQTIEHLINQEFDRINWIKKNKDIEREPVFKELPVKIESNAFISEKMTPKHYQDESSLVEAFDKSERDSAEVKKKIEKKIEKAKNYSFKRQLIKKR